MKNTRYIKHLPLLLLTGLLLCLGSPVFAQMELKMEDLFEEEFAERQEVELLPFDSTRWRELTKDLEYGEVKEEEIPEAEEAEEPLFQERKETGEGFALFLKTMLIITGVGLLVFILYAYFNGGGIIGPAINKKAANIEAEVEALEKDLPDSQLDPILNKAENQEDYKMAIRLRYLKVIQQLAEKEYIVWKKDKTNGQYARELRGTNFEQPFRGLTRLFERLRYGGAELDKRNYQLVIREYQEVEQLIQSAKMRQL